MKQLISPIAFLGWGSGENRSMSNAALDALRAISQQTYTNSLLND